MPAVVQEFKTLAGVSIFVIYDDGTATLSGVLTAAGISTSSADDFGTLGIKADVVAESTSAAGVTVDGMLIKDGGATITGTLTVNDGGLVQIKGAGTGTGDVIEVIGPDATHGMKRSVYEATVSPAAIETALFTVPANSLIESVQANIESALTGGGTTVTASIGVTGDVDRYGTIGAPTDALTKNSKMDWMRTGANAGAGLGLFDKSTVALKLIAAATGGATAGDTALTVGSVKVRVVYYTLMSIADAA